MNHLGGDNIYSLICPFVTSFTHPPTLQRDLSINLQNVYKLCELMDKIAGGQIQHPINL